jgi:hypothetical protein
MVYLMMLLQLQMDLQLWKAWLIMLSSVGLGKVFECKNLASLMLL